MQEQKDIIFIIKIIRGIKNFLLSPHQKRLNGINDEMEIHKLEDIKMADRRNGGELCFKHCRLLPNFEKTNGTSLFIKAQICSTNFEGGNPKNVIFGWPSRSSS